MITCRGAINSELDCYLQIEDPEEAVDELELITEEEDMIGVLEVIITVTILEQFTEAVTEAQDRNVSEWA